MGLIAAKVITRNPATPPQDFPLSLKTRECPYWLGGTVSKSEEKRMASTAPAKFRIDVDIHNLLMNSGSGGPTPVAQHGESLPEPVFPQYPHLLNDPGPETPQEKRAWTPEQVWRKVRGWLIPYIRSRVMPGDFHPITAYLFLEYKCNLDCWYCWAFDNKVRGMTEETAKRSID
jgi:sulfatase maturation enzyme AslB (radical SAM superfamily)